MQNAIQTTTVGPTSKATISTYFTIIFGLLFICAYVSGPIVTILPGREFFVFVAIYALNKTNLQKINSPILNYVLLPTLASWALGWLGLPLVYLGVQLHLTNVLSFFGTLLLAIHFDKLQRPSYVKLISLLLFASILNYFFRDVLFNNTLDQTYRYTTTGVGSTDIENMSARLTNYFSIVSVVLPMLTLIKFKKIDKNIPQQSENNLKNAS